MRCRFNCLFDLEKQGLVKRTLTVLTNSPSISECLADAGGITHMEGLKAGNERIEGLFVYPINCGNVTITFAKVIPLDPLPEEEGERFDFSCMGSRRTRVASGSVLDKNGSLQSLWQRALAKC